MMKSLELNAVITGVRSKVDGSLGLTMATPELTAEEKAEFMKLQGVNITAIFIPLDEKKVEPYKIDRELENKTPSTRLRGVMWKVWELNGMKGDFNEFYRNQMEKLIDAYKEKLN